jgi:argininosuccinate lyase
MSYNRDLQELTPHLWRGMDWARSTVRILNGCLSTVKFNTQRLYECSGAGFSTATELADSLVRATGMPFRTAHQIVGRLASRGNHPTLEELNEAALELAGVKPSCLGFTKEMLERALDPRSNVALRAGTGGPAPAETERMISDRVFRAGVLADMIRSKRRKVETAMDDLRQMQ